MADFCFDCTAELYGDAYADRNEMAHANDDLVWWLCEGCGAHCFTPEGKRLCGRPQSQFADERDVTPEPCGRCVALVAKGAPDGRP